MKAMESPERAQKAGGKIEERAEKGKKPAAPACLAASAGASGR
ncbi:hypothetical protein [Pandoraea cepalis]|nr:hypothetical protein [Pandoraea cepalis]